MIEFARFSVCICTRNRPEELRAAINSVLASSRPAHEIVVSDDSTDTRTRDLVLGEFPSVVYVEGPRRGLGANRNKAIAASSGSHITFIDDDVIMNPAFLADAAAVLGGLGAAAEKAIIGGTEITHGTRVFPHKVSYLGYQAIDYAPGETHETVVINAAIFPRGMFDQVLFDESLVYGCDEMDLSVRAIQLHGYTIVFREALVNNHYPSVVNRAFYAPFGEASRIYVTFKRYWWVERRKLKAAGFLGIAYVHILLYYLRKRGLKGLGSFMTTMRKSLAYIGACSRNSARYV
jgi:glycosyltransferase involved in cell wall biosynthesis